MIFYASSIVIKYNVFLLLVFQTPEKKPNDQRTRKRKAEPYDGSQGEMSVSLPP